MNTKTTIVGVDDGHYAIKTCIKGKCFYMPSRVVYGKKHLTSLMGEYIEDNCYEVDGTILTVAESMVLDGSVIDIRYINYPTSDINAALIHHALYRSGIYDQNIQIVTGLPYSDFFLNGKKNQDLITKKENNLLKRKVQNLNPNINLATIQDHKVLSEGIGGYFDLLYDNQGNQHQDIVDIINKQSIVITDIGGKTTEIIQIALGGNSIVTDRSATINLGMLNLINTIAGIIKNTIKIDNIILERIEEAISTGKYLAFGKEHDVSEIIAQEKAVFARKIQEEHKKILQDGSEIGLHAFIGGGSMHLKEELKKITTTDVRFVKEPQFANARGNWKAGQFVLNWK